MTFCTGDILIVSALFGDISFSFPYLTIILSFFVQKMLYAYYVCCINSNALQINFIMEANTMNLDQTALLSGFILFAMKTTKVHKKKGEQTTIVMNG